MASFQSQYGVRLSRDLSTMKWAEFRAFLSGIDSESPLGKIVSIRAEDKPENLKQFTPQMRRIRNDWRARKAKNMPQKDLNAFLAEMQSVFRGLAGEAHDAKDQVRGMQ